MADYRVRLEIGERILLPSGHGIVSEISADGYSVRDVLGVEQHIPWIDLIPASNAADSDPRFHHVTLKPLVDQLDEATLADLQGWVERIQTITTGFARGHASLARDGEPFYPYGPSFGVSVDQRCQRMALEMTREREQDRELVRRVERGEVKNLAVSKSTVRGKFRAHERYGVAGLIDGRRIRRTDYFDTIDPGFRAELVRIIETLDGDRSTISHREIVRQARVAMKNHGALEYAAPERATGKFVSWLMSSRGTTTRAQRSNKLRKASGYRHFEAVRPGQVIAIDVTRADVLVWDATHERAFSVEIITAIDVATRVVVALRVIPMSADSVDAGLILYDVLRPFSMLVDGTTFGHWRWVGVPGIVDFPEHAVRTESGPIPGLTLQGEHRIPGVLPLSVRVDHGSIFVGQHFRSLLRDFGIDLMLSRGTRPTDNSHIERLHETYQRAYQALPGYKSRSVAGRGRKVADEPLCTAAELEEHLRRWVALDYHQSWHTGLALPDAPKARLTPLEYYDSMLAATGASISVPQTGRLLYQFLPVRWGTVRHDGVEFEDLTYDARCLEAFRSVRRGQFREKDRAMPFFYDPHDLSQVWWPDPDTQLVHEIPCRKASAIEAPMTDLTLDSARTRIKARGGNLKLNRESAQRLILDEVTELYSGPSTREWRSRISAAARRVEASARDHAEAQEAQAAAAAHQSGNVVRLPSPAPQAGDGGVSAFSDEWPDLDVDLS